MNIDPAASRAVFTFEPNPAAVSPVQRAALLETPVFGHSFTDHMATVIWTEGRGWHDARIEARRPFTLDPACAVLHYAQEIFEGLKAYRNDDGDILLFRPDQNARRLNDSARRLAMPFLPEAMFLAAIQGLVAVDADWVPKGEGSLYLRPFMFASEAFLGVRPAREFTFCVIASPAGSYFKAGRSSISLWISDHLNRAGPGGTGAAKCGGNYAASLAAQAEAYAMGCDQVVFLDAIEHRWIDELGGMNLFFVFDDGRVITPPLTGTILPGITRASIISLLSRRGVSVSEEAYAIDQWRADAESGRLRETFACGTAAVVTPVTLVKSNLGDWTIGGDREGAMTGAIRAQLCAIQRGQVEAPEDWVMRVPSRSQFFGS